MDKNELVELVKGIQRLGGAKWTDFIEKQKLTQSDPARHSIELLRSFVSSLLHADDDSVDKWKRYIRWMLWQKDLKESDRATQRKQSHEAASSQKSGISAWDLMERTKNHPRFAASHDFPSFQKGWAWIRKRALAQDSPRLMSIDCEMVETDLERDSLIGFCLCDSSGNVVLKAFVRPRGKVLDYRTELTGLTEKDLEGIQLTREDARKQVKKILSSNGGSIICGHAVHNDLKALRIHHPDVIDTSFIYSYKSLPFCSPGLKDLAKIVLGRMIRGTDGLCHHDVIEDAVVSMQLVQYELGQVKPTPPLEAPDVKVPKEDLCKLLVHSIPAGTSPEDLRLVFPTMETLEVDLSTSNKVLVVFKSLEAANDAFRDASGSNSETDSLGRSTKKINLGPTKTAQVRKMACHNGRLYGKDKSGMKLVKQAPLSGKVMKPQGSAVKTQAKARVGKPLGRAVRAQRSPSRRAVKKGKEGSIAGSKKPKDSKKRKVSELTPPTQKSSVAKTRKPRISKRRRLIEKGKKEQEQEKKAEG